ncbi:MAG TPA: hypothetical protein VOA87_22735 [Thermoanaerobaculia bacterium]|nr:hypothetical protein [Thermoanaerobaculia bacterium]
MADTPISGALGDLKDNLAARAEKARDGVNDGLSTAREKLKSVSDNVSDRYERVSKDVRRGADRATSEIKRGAGLAKEKYEETAASVREGYDKIRSQASDVSSEVSAYVRENPGKSVLIAAGVGFLLGLLFRGRRDTEE